MGYIIFDTQDIIERAHNGDLDYVKHALTLFTDFIAVLVRILIIMVRYLSNKFAYICGVHNFMSMVLQLVYT